MAEHYFTPSPTSEGGEREVTFSYRGKELVFSTGAGTFSRDRLDPGSELLLKAVGEISGLCADIGCGWGAIGLSLAAANPQARLVLTDINERAASLARENARRNGIVNADVLVADGLLGVQGPLAWAVTNPPVRAGKAAVFSFFEQAFERLGPGGTFIVVLRKQQGAPSAKKRLAELFGNCETIARGAGYHVLRSVKGGA